MENNLAHVGVKGMKWGVRRYQNKDGSLTAEGKKRARDMTDDELTSKVRRMNLEKSYNRLSKDTAPKSKVEKTKKVVDASSELINQARKLDRETQPKPTKKRMDLSEMSDQQLREKINRENLERQYNDLFGKESTPSVSKGRQYLTQTLETVGTVLTVGSSALAIALAVKELKG